MRFCVRKLPTLKADMGVRTLLFVLFIMTAAGVTQGQHTAHSWDYQGPHGPAHWGDLDPGFATCKTGLRQSPIDIRNPQKAELPPIYFDYRPSPLDIVDNGHTIMINYAPGSFMSVGGKKYALKQFHFHRPSEERINGRAFEMTAHLVHADTDGNLAVVAVLLAKGDENPLLRELWRNLPGEDKEKRFENIQIDASGILPSDRSYYTFSGSLTTPPCSEDVTWFVLKQAVSISEAEINSFSQLYRDNARPTQPLHGRTVLESR
jgi:carbonic anhydrase